MSAREELIATLRDGREFWVKNVADKRSEEYLADAILAAGYSKPRTITTVEELNALPQDAAVRDAGKTIFEKGLWWNIPGSEADYDSGEIPLPATVLYEPVA